MYIIHGNIPNDRGVIEAPIDVLIRIVKQAVTLKETSQTHFKVLERFGNYTWVELTLETGRTHQTVCTWLILTPSCGDPLYGPRKTLKGNGQFCMPKLGFYNIQKQVRQ